MTEYRNHLTVICPLALFDVANHLATAIGEGIGDLQTFVGAGWEDADGDTYAIISTVVKDVALEKAGAALQRPDFDTESQIDLTKASQAQALIKWDLSDIKGSLTCSTADDYKGFIASTGLTRIPVEIS